MPDGGKRLFGRKERRPAREPDPKPPPPREPANSAIMKRIAAQRAKAKESDAKLLAGKD